MWPTRDARRLQIEAGLQQFSQTATALRGIASKIARQTLARQMIASLRRLDYTAILKARAVHPDRADPTSNMFDPERAAVYHARNGNVNEAIWVIFLSIHFGKNGKHGWRMLRDVYSGLGSGLWTWARVSSQPNAFRKWLRANRAKVGVPSATIENTKRSILNLTVVLLQSWRASSNYVAHRPRLISQRSHIRQEMIPRRFSTSHITILPLRALVASLNLTFSHC